MHVEAGAVIRDKYRVDRVLGEGGMGVVLAAYHVKLEQRVAIKFLRPEMLEHPEIVARFLREARAASRIESDHVARVIDVDELEDGVPFMVLEYLEGSDLANVRGSTNLLPVPVVVDYVLQACKAIAEAHSLGIVHRDLKPANLFLAKKRDGSTRVKVLDFGISKLTGAPGSTDAGIGMTQAAVVMGSVEYMSPEQMLSSRDVNQRTDIWALGVILFELCTGRVPFPGESLPQVCALVMSTTPPSPRSFRPEIPPGLETAILCCLTKDRDKRFASVGALMDAIAPYAGSPSVRFGSMSDGFAPASMSAPDVTRVSGQYPMSARAISSPAVEVLSAAERSTTGGTIAAVSSSRITSGKRSNVPLLVGAVVLVAAGAVAAAFIGRRDTTSVASGASAVPPPESQPSSAASGAVAPPSASAPVVTVAPASEAPVTVPGTTARPGDHVAAVPAAVTTAKKTPDPPRTAVPTAPPPPVVQRVQTTKSVTTLPGKTID